MIVIIDYGMSNLRSIEHKIKKFCKEIKITSNPDEISNAKKLILPGVGAFKIGIKNIKKNNLYDVLNEKVIKRKTPILGICLGMQLMTESSQEGNAKGLGWLKGQTIKFSFDKQKSLKIPHVGWNSLDIKAKSILFRDIPSDTYFYFSHSYYVSCDNKEDILSTTNYGYDFVSAIQSNNIYGTQFHPEKSHKIGMKVIQNFVEFA